MKLRKINKPAIIICMLVLIASANRIFALESQTTTCLIIGKIIDSQTKQPLPNANIQIDNRGAISDEMGHFKVNLSPGKYHFKVSYIGYKKKEFDVVIKNQDETIKLDILLEPVVLEGKTIGITADKNEIFNYEIIGPSIRNMPGPLPDALLSLRTLPGVTALNDQSTFYNVRGGNFDENLIYINGVEIYQPHIVRKGYAENPSIVNSSLIKSINLRTGVFPVSYGDKLSSVLDITYQDTVSSPISVSSEFSTVSINAAFMAGLNKNCLLIFGFRKINYGYLHSGLQTKGNYTPNFLDFQGVLNYRLNDKLSFQLFGIHAESAFYVEPSNWQYKEWIYGNEFVDKFRSLYNGKEEYQYTTRLLTFTLNYRINEWLKLNWNNSLFKQKETEDTGLNETSLYLRVPRTAPYIEPRLDRYDEKAVRTRTVNGMMDSEFYSSKLDLTWQSLSFYNIMLGIEYKQFDLADKLFEFNQVTTDSNKIYIDPVSNYSIHSSRNGYLIGRYIQSNIFLGHHISVNTGLRWTVSSLNKEQLFMPRIQVIWAPSNILEFILAAGKYAQPPLYKEFQFREAEDSGLLAQKAEQYTVGFKRYYQNNLSLKVEAYYKNLHDLISYDLYDVKIRYSGYNDAKGYAYGLDAFLYGELIPDTENWISYSYLVAQENLYNNNEDYIPRPSDRRHLFAFYLEDYMEKYRNSRFFIRFVYGSGFPFTWRQYVFNHETTTFELQKGRRNQSRIPHYSRFDVGFSQNFKLHKTLNITLREEVLNLFNHVNVISYELAFNRIIKQYLSGRVYNIGMRIEF